MCPSVILAGIRMLFVHLLLNCTPGETPRLSLKRSGKALWRPFSSDSLSQSGRILIIDLDIRNPLDSGGPIAYEPAVRSLI
jgi:hypothetical protein